MNSDSFRKLHKNDYIYFKHRRWDDEPYREFVGFIVKKTKAGASVYIELSLDGKEWDDSDVFVYPSDVFHILELKTLLDQIQENYPEILL